MFEPLTKQKPFFRLGGVEKTILVFLVFLSLMGSLDASDPGIGKPRTVRLGVSGLPDPSGTEPMQIAALRVQEEFQKRHPEVDLVPVEGIRLENMVSETTTVMLIAGGIAPDVLKMNFRSADGFIKQGMVAPLEEFLDAETRAARDEILARIPDQVAPVVNRLGPDGQRHLYGLPSDFKFTGIYFNKELFRRAGLPLRAPKDWDELVLFCQALKKLGPTINPLNLAKGSVASWNLLTFIWSSGGEAVVETGPGDWRAAFDSPAAVTAYEFYYKLVEADRLATRLNLQGGLQNTGLIFSYVGDSLLIDPEKFGFGAVPAGPDGLRGAEINASVLGVFSGITNPDIKRAAWNYVAFMSGRVAEQIKVQTMVDLGLAAQVNPVLLRRYGYDQYIRLMPVGLEAEFALALETGKPEPYGKNCNLVYTEMTYPLDQILLSRSIAKLWAEGDREGVRAEIGAILKRAVVKTNERMLGYVPPENMKTRRVVAVLVVVGIFGGFLWLVVHIWSIFSKAGALTSKPVASKGMLPWIFLAPALALTLTWSYLPLIRGTGMAFQDYQLILPSKFVGLDNFANVLFDGAFWNSLLATFHYAAWTLTIGFAAPIALAYALHLIPKHKIFFRILYYLPAVISSAAVFFLWRELFGAESILNQILRMMGFEARRAWTDEPALAMLSCVLPGIWAGVGPGCLIYLAALKTIPVEQFEAAEIDGAGFLAKTRLIVYPGLKGLIVINFTGAVAASFHGATNILIMTGGGPNGATEVTSLLLFFEAFTRLRFGHATAMAWIIGSLLIGFTVLQLQRLSRMEFKTAK
jgi:multiple sugar transport system permease protein